MAAIQPTLLWRYLSTKRTNIPTRLKHFFYASWEDALWDLLIFFAIQPESVALVPEFFCGDVVKNMEAHGLRVVWYPISRELQTDPKVLATWIKKYQPKVLVIFHAVGMTNKLFAEKSEWLSELPTDCLLIEDSVHRIVDPGRLRLLSRRHIVLDSLRKVLPLAGSNLYGGSALARLKPNRWQRTISYQVQVYGWWLIFQKCLFLSILPFGRSWQLFWNRLSEVFMLRGYDVIGDSRESGAGWPVFDFLFQHVDYRRIEKTKAMQVEFYQKLLAPLKKDQRFFFFEIDQKDRGLIRAFPLGLRIKTADEILAKLRERGVLTRFELNDSAWSQKQKIIYLPLGPYLSEIEVENIAQTVLSVAQTANQ